MRSYALLIAGSAAFAVAQSGSGIPEIPTPTNVDAEASSIAAEINDCLSECDDLECQAACIAVPAPNESQVNANTACAEECDQGDGSESDTQAYGECLAQCASEHYFSAGEGTPQPTGADSDDEETATQSDVEATASDVAESVASDVASSVASDDASASGESESDATASDSEEASATGDSDEASESEESEGDEDSGAKTVAAGSALGLFGFAVAFFL